jgi:hypothetical protein
LFDFAHQAELEFRDELTTWIWPNSKRAKAFHGIYLTLLAMVLRLADVDITQHITIGKIEGLCSTINDQTVLIVSDGVDTLFTELASRLQDLSETFMKLWLMIEAWEGDKQGINLAGYGPLLCKFSSILNRFGLCLSTELTVAKEPCRIAHTAQPCAHLPRVGPQGAGSLGPSMFLKGL